MLVEVVMAGDESGCSQLVAVVQAAQFHCRPGPHHTTIAMQSSVLCICNISMRISQLYNMCHTVSVDFRNF